MGEIDLLALFKAAEDQVDEDLKRVHWAEEEIQAAILRHPSARDTIWHALKLLSITSERVKSVEFIYRSHCRELLDRLAAGKQTVRGTAAEAVLVCSEASKAVPVHGAAAGLYFRLWSKAFPDKLLGVESELKHYEALYGSKIDDMERELRLRINWVPRKLGNITCDGMHHGESVRCKYAKGN